MLGPPVFGPSVCSHCPDQRGAGCRSGGASAPVLGCLMRRCSAVWYGAAPLTPPLVASGKGAPARHKR